MTAFSARCFVKGAKCIFNPACLTFSAAVLYSLFNHISKNFTVLSLNQEDAIEIRPGDGQILIALFHCPQLIRKSLVPINSPQKTTEDQGRQQENHLGASRLPSSRV